MKLKEHFYGIIALLILSFSTISGFIPIFFLGLCKLVPNRRWKNTCSRWIDKIAILWCDINNACIKNNPVKWQLNTLDGLSPNDSYLVIANHQSWLDIVVLQWLFNRKIPILKFFIKDQLKWIPLLGFTWWAMGCPFMKRYTKHYLERHPHKKGKDLETVRKAVSLFKEVPTSIMNFVEGTRYTARKHQEQNSPYQHLLKPKTGGISYVLSSMGQQFKTLLDVTIIYPQQNHSLWDFLCRRLETVQIHVQQVAIPVQFTGESLTGDDGIQAKFREWLNTHWLSKDKLISEQQKRLTNKS